MRYYNASRYTWQSRCRFQNREWCGDEKGEMLCNARFPRGPSALVFALNSCGSILVSTGPAPSGTFAKGRVRKKRS